LRPVNLKRYWNSYIFGDIFRTQGKHINIMYFRVVRKSKIIPAGAKRRSLFIGAILFSCLLAFSCSRDTDRSADDRPYVVILSIDGCRWDYPNIHGMPNLIKIGEEGVSAESIIPSYPSKTFPNHYTMATGLYPDHHGIVANNFYEPEKDLYYSIGKRERVEDPDFYGGEPIWETAEKQGVRTASFFWVGSETSSPYHPSIRKYFDDEIPFTARVDSAVSWLYLPEKTRPHLIMFYFEEPDGTGHKYGPESPETGEVLAYVDSLIGLTRDKIDIAEEELGIEVNFIVTSDHGMGYIPPENNIFLDENIDIEDLEAYAGGNPVYTLQPAAGRSEKIFTSLSGINGLKVWEKDNLPAHYHYGSSNRIFDLIVEADSGWGVRMRNNGGSGYSLGAHGYDPQNRDMHAIFYAEGPAFKTGYLHSSFENICLYPLLAEILNLEPADVDGDLERVQGMLKD
jgi:alkaline phosphatase D